MISSSNFKLIDTILLLKNTMHKITMSKKWLLNQQSFRATALRPHLPCLYTPIQR